MSAAQQAQKQQSTGATGAPDKLGKTEQTAIIEDDEFEEFPSEEWDETGEDTTDKQLWEDNWDDDDVEDDFSCQLRAELERLGHKTTQFPPVKQ